MHLSRFEKGVICGVTFAGIGVMTTAALAAELGERKKPEEETAPLSLSESELNLPSLPASKEELVRMWASGYERFKKPLSDVFRIAGQILVAPLAMVVIDATYVKYLDYIEARSDTGVTVR